MACFVNVISVAIFICSFVKNTEAQGAQVQGVDNAEQFALLCRIYNVAKNPPINHVDLQDPLNIVKEIDVLNGSIAEKKQFNETEEYGNSSDPAVKPTITREAAVAQAILSRITQKAHTILKEIKKTNISEEIEKVKAEFSQVIFGDGGSETKLDQGALRGITGRSAACGNPGLSHKGSHSGENLVVDFFCLCAMKTENNDGLKEVCGVEVGGSKQNGKHGWGDTAPLGSPSMWASIKKGCGKLMYQHPKSTKEGYDVLADFLKHTKSGGVYRLGLTSGRDNTVKGSDRKDGMLGTAVGEEGKNGTDLICDGSRGNKRSGKTVDPAGICVYYGQKPDWQSIHWFRQLKTALSSVDTLNNTTATIQRDIQKLHMLLHRAEQIYETTKVITEIQNPVLPTNLQTAAKRLTAYNAAWRLRPINHLILLWVLFL